MKLPICKLAAALALTASAFVAPATLAASATAYASLDGISLSTTGTASAVFTGSPLDVFSAIATTDGGVDDLLNDAMLFESELSPFGEATAVNGGIGGGVTSSSFADAAIVPGMAFSSATTFVELELELSGAGDIIIDLFYTLEVDIADSLPDGFASAGITGGVGFLAPAGAALDVVGGTPFDFDSDIGVLTLVFAFDDFGFGPVPELLTVDTFAAVKASAVPVPAAVWLLGSALGAVGFRRRVL